MKAQIIKTRLGDFEVVSSLEEKVTEKIVKEVVKHHVSTLTKMVIDTGIYELLKNKNK